MTFLVGILGPPVDKIYFEILPVCNLKRSRTFAMQLILPCVYYRCQLNLQYVVKTSSYQNYSGFIFVVDARPSSSRAKLGGLPALGNNNGRPVASPG